MIGGRLRAAAALAVGLAACGGDDVSEGGSGRTASGAQSGAKAGAPWFEEVALESGVDFEHVNATQVRHWFPEIIGAGLAWLDADGDGDLDLYCVQSGDLESGDPDVGRNRLFLNDGGRFTDATTEAGVGHGGYGMGCAVADYDGDGDVDLYVTNYGPNVLYRNDGDGTFTDATEAAGVGDPGFGLSAGFVDYDLDGDLDLFVTNYVNWAPEREVPCMSPYGTRSYCHPRNYDAPATDTLYRNDGDGTFTDVTREVGIDKAFGNGMGVSIADFDGDGGPEIFVANDGMANQLWTRGADGRFEDRALLAGCAVNMAGKAEASMGTAAVDVDQDGDVDLFMTHLRDESNTFYLNQGGSFSDKTPQTGLGPASLEYTGFGMGFADFDCDGKLDLYVANGRVGDQRPYCDPAAIHEEPNQLFRGLGETRFEEVSPRGGLVGDWLGTGRGVAFGDYDDDGDVDLAVSDNAGRVHLLRNVARGGRSWIGLRLLDENGSDALGATVTVTAGGATGRRYVQTCYSYCSANDPRAHFGLGDAARAEAVVVRWPGGDEEGFGPLDAGSYHVLRRGEGTPAGR